MTETEPIEEHLDPTPEVTLEVVKQRAIRGVAVLTGRTFILSVLSLVATGFLASSEFFGLSPQLLTF